MRKEDAGIALGYSRKFFGVMIHANNTLYKEIIRVGKGDLVKGYTTILREHDELATRMEEIYFKIKGNEIPNLKFLDINEEIVRRGHYSSIISAHNTLWVRLFNIKSNRVVILKKIKVFKEVIEIFNNKVGTKDKV